MALLVTLVAAMAAFVVVFASIAEGRVNRGAGLVFSDPVAADLSPAFVVGQPQASLLVTKAGETLITLTNGTGACSFAVSATVACEVVFARGGDGQFTDPEVIPPPGSAFGFAAPDGTVTIVGGRLARGGIDAATRPPGGTFGPAVPLVTTPGHSLAFSVAQQNENGDLAFVTEIGPPQADLSKAEALAQAEVTSIGIVRRPAGLPTFGPFELIPAQPDGYYMRPVVNERGDFLLVWTDGKHGQTQVMAVSATVGGPLSEPVVIGPIVRGFATRLQAALNNNGQMAVAWESAAPGRPRQSDVEVARGQLGAGFGPPQQITREPAGSPRIALDDSNATTVTWQRPRTFDRSHNSVGEAKMAVSTSGGPFGPPRVLSGRGASPPGVVTSPDGTAVVAWHPSAQFGTRALVGHPSAHKFGRPQLIGWDPSDIVFDKRGRPIVVSGLGLPRFGTKIDTRTEIKAAILGQTSRPLRVTTLHDPAGIRFPGITTAKGPDGRLTVMWIAYHPVDAQHSTLTIKVSKLSDGVGGF